LFGLLTSMIEHGLPLNRTNGQGHHLGWVLLVKAAQGAGLPENVWNAFRTRALATGDGSVASSYLQQTAAQLEAAFALDPA
ncbi:hypothetical protein, partial [Salmonella enterica]|uniref:hypothetical protein n=1 Tax=Salmonella enterica TaxID=28901 RepID=UPI0020C3ADC6